MKSWRQNSRPEKHILFWAFLGVSVFLSKRLPFSIGETPWKTVGRGWLVESTAKFCDSFGLFGTYSPGLFTEIWTYHFPWQSSHVCQFKGTILLKSLLLPFHKSLWEDAILSIHIDVVARVWKAQNKKLQDVLEKTMLGREKGVEGSHVFLEPMVNESESCRHWMSKIKKCRTDDVDWISCLCLSLCFCKKK